MAFVWPSDPLSSSKSRSAIRQTIIEQIYSARSGHPGGSLSLVEILAAIFGGHFEHSPKDPFFRERDRLVLSKGHGVPALYSFLSRLGYFDPAELLNLRKLGHFLQGHPDKYRYPLMEASTGSLGQGASVALGLALGLQADFIESRLHRLPRVYCILGDGEMQEGQVWECLMSAGKFRPGNLVFILDHNKGQIDGPVSEVMSLDPIADKIRAFNLDVVRVDGHDVAALNGALAKFKAPRVDAAPLFIVADTVKGKGVSFMEHPTKWHGAAPSKIELLQALGELFGQDGRSPFGNLIEISL
jgi:transketolase